MKDPDYGLEEYNLTSEQWKLAASLTDVLVVCTYIWTPDYCFQLMYNEQIYKQVSGLFSTAEVPLIYKVIPMLEDMEHELKGVRNNVNLADVIRMAAHAALLMIGKYYALTDDSEVYRIAMGASCDFLNIVEMLIPNVHSK